MDWKTWKKTLREQKIYSFDYDNTLITYKADPKDGDHGVYDKEHEDNITLVRKLATSKENKVIIVTSRKKMDKKMSWDKSPSPEELVKKLNLPISEIHYTDGEYKAETLRSLGVSEHWDDDPDEIVKIKELNDKMGTMGTKIVANAVAVNEEIFEKLHRMWANKLQEHGYPVPEKMKKYLVNEGISTGKMTGVSVQQTLDLLNSFGDNTWIFFDTETGGFNQNKDQITEIAAVAVNPNNWVNPEMLGTYHEKIKLNPDMLRRLNDPESPERLDWEKEQDKQYRRLDKPQDVLKLTRYGQKGVDYKDEQATLEEFKNFILEYPNPVLVAQNATFDMKFVNARIKEKLPRLPVIDTVPLLKFQLIPFLQSISDIGNVSKLNIKDMTEEQKAEFLQVFNKAQAILKIIGGRGGPSASLGKVAAAFEIDTGEWHNALADTKMLVAVLQKTVEMLRLIEKYNVKTFLYHLKAISKDRGLKKFLSVKKKKKLEEDYQDTITQKHSQGKKRLVTTGPQGKGGSPYKIKVSTKRSKSAPAGFGALEEMSSMSAGAVEIAPALPKKKKRK